MSEKDNLGFTPNSIIHGDALDILRSLPAASVDVVITDPPYDLSREAIEQLHEQFMRVTRTGAIVFASPLNPWVAQAGQYGFWIKPISTKNTSRQYSRFVEQIAFYGDLKWRIGGHWSQYTNVFTEIVESSVLHPYSKPVALMERLIRNHTEEGDLVLDPFIGSGTTAVACRRLGRRYIGIEADMAYVACAIDRLIRTPGSGWPR